MLALSNKASNIAKEAVASSQEPKRKKSVTKGGKDWLDEMVTKQEIIDRVGILDPVIQSNVESTLSTISYKGKSKAEVTTDIVNDLEKQVEKLKYQRVKMLQEQQQKASMKYSRNEYQKEEEERVLEDPEEILFDKAYKEKNIEKLEDIVEKRKSKLEELEKKWRERKEIGQMRKSGLLDSNNYQKLQVSQKSGYGNLYNQSNVTAPPSQVATSGVSARSVTKPPQDRPITQALIGQESVLDKDENLKELLKKSEKLKALDPRRSDFQNKLSDYLVGKRLRQDTEEYYQTKEKKNFERHTSPVTHRKSQERTAEPLKISGAPISHLPKIQDDKLPQQPEKENRQNNFQSKSPEKKVNKRKIQEINELFIIKLVFDALNHKNDGRISKDEVIDYVMTNQDIVTIFDLKTSFSTEILTFPSETVGQLTFQEFSQLMMKRLPPKTQNDIKSAFSQEVKEKEKPKPPMVGSSNPDMLLAQADIDILNQVFTNLDQYEDLLLKTEDLLNALRGDLRVQKIIKKPAVKIPVIDRELTVGEILDQIETDMTTAIENETNTMQYISWNQFFDYFKTYKASKFTRAPQATKEEEEEILLSEDKIQVIQDVFDSLPRVAEDYVDKVEFVKASKRDPQVHAFWKVEVDSTNNRTVGQLFDSILASEVNYLKWEDVLPFFTRSGAKEVPNEDEEIEAVPESTQTYKNEFPTFAPDHISEAGEEESMEDPSFEKPVNKEKAKQQVAKAKVPTKTNAKRNDKMYEPRDMDNLDAELRKEYEMLQEDLKSYGIVKKLMKDEKGLTIPKPFKFKNSEAKSIRKQKVEKMVEEKRKEEEDALNFKFRANELPAYVRVPMYNTITKAQEERRMEITEKSKQITMANQKPFSFYERELNKSKSQPKEEVQPQFKANPVPQICKTEILKDKEEEEKKKRADRIKQRIEENAANVKMPERMEMHEKAKKEGTAKTRTNPNKYKEPEATFQPNIKKDVPDFNQLQKEFDDTLQNKKKERPKTQFQPFQFQKKEESVREASQQEESRSKISKKDVPKKPPKAMAASKPKPVVKKSKKQEEEEAEEEQQQEQEEPQEANDEEEYPPDEEEQNNAEEENEAGQEEGGSKREGNSNMEEEEKGDDGGFFEVESQQGGGDEAFNPNLESLKPRKEKPAKVEKAASEKSEKMDKSVRSQASQKSGALQNTGDMKQGDKKKPALTKKLEQEFERRKQEKEALEKRAQDKKKEDADRKQKEKDFAPKVVTAYNTVNRLDKREAENQEKMREYKERMKREQEDYNERIKEMKTRVDSAPLIIENKLHGSRFLKKYRDAIAKGWMTLEGPGNQTKESKPQTGSELKKKETEQASKNQVTKSREVKEYREKEQSVRNSSNKSLKPEKTKKKVGRKVEEEEEDETEEAVESEEGSVKQEDEDNNAAEDVNEEREEDQQNEENVEEAQQEEQTEEREEDQQEEQQNEEEKEERQEDQQEDQQNEENVEEAQQEEQPEEREEDQQEEQQNEEQEERQEDQQEEQQEERQENQQQEQQNEERQEEREEDQHEEQQEERQENQQEEQQSEERQEEPQEVQQKEPEETNRGEENEVGNDEQKGNNDEAREPSEQYEDDYEQEENNDAEGEN